MSTSESSATFSKVKPRRLYSFPSQSEYDETDFVTASEFFPVSVPLDKVQIGSISYVSKEWNDVEVVYELESSDVLVRCSIEGQNGEPQGTYRVRGVSAADLSLVCVVPGSLESMVSRLILELEEDIVFEPQTSHPLLVNESSPNEEPSESKIADGNLKSRILKLSASVHEAGHFRDVLLFLKCENVADLNPEIAYIPQKVATSDNSKDETDTLEQKPPRLTFLDFLPFWVMYIPWRLYSRNTRTVIQRVILVYYIFSAIWASWQLYRHVYVIHFVLEPIIGALKYYLASVMETFDWCLSLFTRFWHFYLSPLNVLGGLLITPLFQVITPVVTVVAQCLKNSAVFTALKSVWTILYQLSLTSWGFTWSYVALLGKPLWAFWSVLKVLGKPFSGVWQATLNTRVAVASLDFQRLRLSWVFSLVIGSLKSIGNGLAWFAGYTHKTQKRRKAILNTSQTSPINSPSRTPQHGLRNRRMPMYYSSSLSKQN